MSARERIAGNVASYVDDRTGAAAWMKKNLQKVFPDHWSFMLGEIALYSFVILLLSGTFLTFWFDPSMREVVYDGAYVPLQGVEMSAAYASALDISFEVRGGLLMRQIHHWSALIFMASIVVHLMRVFFTGAFRKPREFNWILGIGLLTLGIVEGFLGYSLPDDLLSGTGIRIAHAIIQAVPVVGTFLAFLLFGGEFPGIAFIPRIYTVHILILPGIFLALITVHLMLVWYQKHTQYPGPGRTEKNVVGYSLMPIYMAKAGGFFFIVFGVTAFLGAVASINPLWLYGPYTPGQVTAGSQPDWYMGWLDGLVRMAPPLEPVIFGYTLSLNILIPGLIVPGIIFTGMALYPFIEQWITGDKREHHILDRPRNAPNRTALGVMSITFMLVALLNGGNDLIATAFDLSINQIMWFSRIGIIVLPPLAFIITKRLCLSLQRADRELVLHGRETGRLVMMPSGEFVEVHEPISAEKAWLLTQHEQNAPLELEESDNRGVRRPGLLKSKLRKRFAVAHAEQVPKPTMNDVREIEHH
ncbi:menaquinol-cytochrome C reductase cytochrome b subunit [freshwater metagenome]|jgi:ubiquinol-cytochrome c reductase cytochrome b subunit|uniref:Menaquinol-cytochrome C reductase cytochrome b subunit n=1 Tax=freshwater metagenome TaxID=449393 RepID=A0A094QDY5_9ZZZZ